MHGGIDWRMMGNVKYHLDDDISEEQEQAIQNAVLEWDTKIEPLVLEEESNKEESDITIRMKADNMHEEIAGQTTTIADRSGFIIKAQVTLFKETNGNYFDAVTIGRVAKHEMGHALGLGHANFNRNLMAERVNSGAASISECEVNAVIMANYWRLGDSSIDHYSDVESPRSYNGMC